MKGRLVTMEDLGCISEMQPSSLAFNVEFIRKTAQDAYGHLKEFGKIKAENSSHRTTIRQQKNRIANLETELARARRERDAAVKALATFGDCSFCKHELLSVRKEPCVHCYTDGRGAFEWRGLCKYNGGAPADDH